MGQFLKMNYKTELIKSMNWLSKKQDTIFIGQAVKFSGHALSGTLSEVSKNKCIEMPVFEETQLGISTGLALSGFIPISIFPRMDFFIISLNQLVNHLDKLREMSENTLSAKVIIRVAIGTKIPFSAGPQHTQNHSKALKSMLTDINIVELKNSKNIFAQYKYAYERKDNKSTLFIEYGDFYATK